MCSSHHEPSPGLTSESNSSASRWSRLQDEIHFFFLFLAGQIPRPWSKRSVLGRRVLVESVKFYETPANLIHARIGRDGSISLPHSRPTNIDSSQLEKHNGQIDCQEVKTLCAFLGVTKIVLLFLVVVPPRKLRGSLSQICRFVGQ